MHPITALMLTEAIEQERRRAARRRPAGLPDHDHRDRHTRTTFRLPRIFRLAAS